MSEPLSIKRAEAELQQRRFEAYAHDFVRRWSPSDIEQSARFSAELFSLVRLIYMDAVEPFTKQLADVMMRQPIKPFVIEK